MLIKPATTASQIRRGAKLRPRLGIVLGSGFNGVTTRMEVESRFPYKRLRGFPPTQVAGHSGELIIGKLAGTPVAVLSGRSHFYEGHSMEQVTFAVRVLAALGITDLLLTNAAGGIRSSFRPGDFMAITDHINLMGVNPLRGVQDYRLPQFIDLSETYCRELLALLKQSARRVSLPLRSGVYLAVCGPSYETPAEIRAFTKLGADAVGMSTVPEAIVARQCGMRVAGLSCITNLAAGCAKTPLSHKEVLETGEQVKPMATRLISEFARLYGKTR